jgi:putative flippase GtrA
MQIPILDSLQDAAHRYLPPPLREFAKFGIVGTFGFIVDFSTYGLLTRVLGWNAVYCLGFDGTRSILDLATIRDCSAPHYPIVAANMISVLLAVTSNFFLNKFWTFRDPRQGTMAVQGIAYFVMSTITWALNQVLTGVFASRLDILHLLFPQNVDIAAKILAVGVVLFVNFSGSKFVIFRREPEQPEDA